MSEGRSRPVTNAICTLMRNFKYEPRRTWNQYTMQGARALLAALLLVLAGCSGVFGGAESTPTDGRPTVGSPTPEGTAPSPGEPTPTATATATPTENVPGPAEQFRSWVEYNTQVPFEFETVNDSVYRIYADDDLGYRDDYDASNEPLPEAVSIAMSWADGPPERVEFVVDGYDGNVAWRFSINDSVAWGIYNHSITPSRLDRAINRTETRTEHFPETDEPMEIRHLTWAEARMSYAKHLAKEVQEPVTRYVPEYGNYTQEANVVRYGNYNGEISWEGLDGSVPRNESIFIDLQYPRKSGEIGTYTETGFASITVEEKWLEIAQHYPYGRLPNLHIRFVDSNETVYQTYDLLPQFTKDAIEEGGYGLEIYRTVEYYNRTNGET